MESDGSRKKNLKIRNIGARVFGRAIFFALATGAVALLFSGCSPSPPENERPARKETAETKKAPSAAARRGPRLAIIIDDMGNDRDTNQAVLAIPYPLTVSVLPHKALSETIANEAAQNGDEVLLHLPMQPDSAAADTEPIELRVGMPAGEVHTVLAGMLATVPHVVGVNNHEGSAATADPALMGELMPELRSRRLFFIDSRTTASTVAADAAQKYGVRSASRKVFLDDSLDSGAIQGQIELAERDAEHDGEAIAIGHPHAETIAALKAALPRAKKDGIRFVFASELVR